MFLFQCIHSHDLCTWHQPILDDVPHKKAMAIQNSLKSLMGKSMYYRIRNKQRRLHPSEQKQIADVFLEHGIKTKINFDEYIEDYDW